MAIFDYPIAPRRRRHGPSGYANYESYRAWLRDEFTFRCVYCLKREQWSRVTHEFRFDYFMPHAITLDLKHEYDNLVYACNWCTRAKGDQQIPDPCFTGDQVRVNPDGTITTLSDDAARIIHVLGLNSGSYNQWRAIWIRNVELAEQYAPDLYLKLMRFPDDLPDLARLRPPGNMRPQGIQESSFAKRERGELAETY